MISTSRELDHKRAAKMAAVRIMGWNLDGVVWLDGESKTGFCHDGYAGVILSKNIAFDPCKQIEHAQMLLEKIRLENIWNMKIEHERGLWKCLIHAPGHSLRFGWHKDNSMAIAITCAVLEGYGVSYNDLLT